MALRASSNPTTSALFGVAAIQATVGLIGWFIYSPEFQPIDWIATFSFAVYFAFGVWARWRPKPATLSAALSYAAFLGVQARISLDLLFTGWIFKLPICVLLIVAFVSARQTRAPRSEVFAEKTTAAVEPPDADQAVAVGGTELDETR